MPHPSLLVRNDCERKITLTDHLKNFSGHVKSCKINLTLPNIYGNNLFGILIFY